MRKRCLSTGLCAFVVFAGLLVAPTEAATAATGPRADARHRLVGPLTDVSRAARGPRTTAPLRVADPDAFARQKAEAVERAAGGPSAPITAQAAPTFNRSWQGINDPCCQPSDSTSAIGTKRFIELVNDSYAIYNRTSDLPLDTGTSNFLVGSGFASVFDPQIIWDPGTGRFYYAWVQTESPTNNRISFGFSRTAAPNTGGDADWCKYSIGYGNEFADFPKLGDTKDFLLFGLNVYGSDDSYLRSDVVWTTKPSAGTGCPAASTFGLGSKEGLTNKDGSLAFTPVPANQTDTSGTGWIVARARSLPAQYLSLFKVTKNATTGGATVGAAKKLSVPSYSIPADAPQPGTTKRLDTSDARPTQAVSAIDPSRGTGSSVAIWTQHTVAGGAGAEVRWYEIDPVVPGLFQSGVVSGTEGLHVFNGAISPDRKVAGASKLFGANMVLGVNTSSTSQVADFRIQSKVGTLPPSALVGVVPSNGSVTSDCSAGVCRWGDYAAATPDPGASATAASGNVWLTSQLTFGGSSFDWATWNVSVTP